MAISDSDVGKVLEKITDARSNLFQAGMILAREGLEGISADTIKLMGDLLTIQEEIRNSLRNKTRLDENTMPPGKYWIIDPCYVIANDDWHSFLDFTNYFNGNASDSKDRYGLYEYNGHRVAVCSTAWGDGGYQDQYGNQYSVDAGCIGVVPLELVANDENYHLGVRGHYVEFDEPFEVEYDGAVITFGNFTINTDY